MALSLEVGLFLMGTYLIGSIPFGWIVARAKRVDIRRCGSGNIGATNVGRVLGRRWSLLVFSLDLAKGLAATLVATWLGVRLARTNPAVWTATRSDLLVLGAGIGCLIGNTASVFLGFRGGKGAATSAGLILGSWPWLTGPGLIAICVWAAVLRLSGYVSLGSLAAAVSLPVAFVAIAAASGWSLRQHLPLLLLCLGVTIIVTIRHRSNIARLIAGTENKAGPNRR